MSSKTPSPTPKPIQNWDIFCTVIDNFGDIGVCWRLARQLANEYGFQIRLWVDDLASFARIEHALLPFQETQSINDIEIRHWTPTFPVVNAADVVIEAFGCPLPERYLAAMQKRRPVWINLEYLSAEAWVASCHGLPSPQLGLKKYFFFPSFTSNSGGVLGEQAQLQARERWSAANTDRYLAQFTDVHPEALTVSLFAYENEAISPLLKQWSNGLAPIHVFVPEGRALAQVQTALNLFTLNAGQTVQQGSLRLTCLPMLPQQEYDHLLWSCALNFVRGEDSFVRAQWAALPMVWHIYPQDEAAHLIKLEAFLERYGAALDPLTNQALRDFWRHWNHGTHTDAVWLAFAAALPKLNQHAKQWAKRLKENGDLASNLVKFVESKVE